MLKNIFINIKGFTLIELIISIAIIGIILVALNSIVIFGYNNFLNVNERADIQRSIRLIEKIINEHVRYASSIKINNKKEPTGKNSYQEILSLGNKNNETYKLIYNGRPITNNIIKEMSVINISKTYLEIEFEFVNNKKLTIYTLLNNITD